MATDSQRLQLHPYAPEHWLALMESEEAFHRCSGLHVAEGLRDSLLPGEISPAWLAQLREATAADPWVHGFAVVERASSLVIGNAGCKGPPDDAGMVEIAYGIAPAFQGRGYATEAACKLIAFACRDPRVRLLRAHTLPASNASGRVLIKNGFTRVGEVVDPDDGLVWRWEQSRHQAGERGHP